MKMKEIIRTKKFRFVIVILTALALAGIVFVANELGQEKSICQLVEQMDMRKLTEVSKNDCQKCGGKWELLSMDLDMTGCNPKTSDAGKTCLNESDCVGVCLAKNISSVSGDCSDYKFVLGCNLEFSGGKPVELCRD